MESKTSFLWSRTKSLLYFHCIQYSRGYATKFKPITAPPRITVPHKLFQKIQKLQDKRVQEQEILKSKIPRNRVPLITCKNKKLNQFKGQTYSRFVNIPLASSGWYKNKTRGDYFVIHGIEKNPAIISRETNEENYFKDLGLNDEVCNGLEKMGIVVPTNIQMLAIPSILAGKNVLCASETGSGKTLAYLAPLIEKLIKNEKKKEKNRPRGLILVPTRELAEQVDKVAETLSNFVPFEKQLLIGGPRRLKPKDNTRKECFDLLIATPVALLKMLSKKIYNLQDVGHIVLDEVDTLLDDSFNKMVVKILKNVVIREEDPQNIAAMTSGTQLTLVGATLPKGLAEIFEDVVRLESLTEITTQYLHKLTLHIPHKFIRIASIDRPSKIVELVQANVKSKIPTMIFCNKSKCCEWLSFFLTVLRLKTLV